MACTCAAAQDFRRAQLEKKFVTFGRGEYVVSDTETVLPNAIHATCRLPNGFQLAGVNPEPVHNLARVPECDRIAGQLAQHRAQLRRPQPGRASGPARLASPPGTGPAERGKASKIILDNNDLLTRI